MLLKILSRYSFDVYPSAVLGNNFKNVKITALLDAITASQYTDIMALYESVRPTLPAGTVTDPLRFTYVRLENALGASVVLAYEYINEATITEVLSSRTNIVVNNTSTTDAARIRDLLLTAGYVSIEITTL